MPTSLLVFLIGAALTLLVSVCFLVKSLISRDDMWDTGFYLSLATISFTAGILVSALVALGVVVGANSR